MKPMTVRCLSSVCGAALFFCLCATIAQAELNVPITGNQTMGSANSPPAQQAQLKQQNAQQLGATGGAGGTLSKNMKFTSNNTVKGNINAANGAQVSIGGLDLGGGKSTGTTTTSATVPENTGTTPATAPSGGTLTSGSVSKNAGTTPAATAAGGTPTTSGGQQSQTGNAQSTSSQNSATKAAQDAVAQILSTKGKCIDTDGLYGCQCKDLSNYYLKEIIGVKSVPAGNAIAFKTWSPLPDGLTKSSTPQVGDVFVKDYWGTNDKGVRVNYGHTGIVTAVYPDGSFDTIEQNAGSNSNRYTGTPAATYHRTATTDEMFIHPNF